MSWTQQTRWKLWPQFRSRWGHFHVAVCFHYRNSTSVNSPQQQCVATGEDVSISSEWGNEKKLLQSVSHTVSQLEKFAKADKKHCTFGAQDILELCCYLMNLNPVPHDIQPVSLFTVPTVFSSPWPPFPVPSNFSRMFGFFPVPVFFQPMNSFPVSTVFPDFRLLTCFPFPVPSVFPGCLVSSLFLLFFHSITSLPVPSVYPILWAPSLFLLFVRTFSFLPVPRVFPVHHFLRLGLGLMFFWTFGFFPVPGVFFVCLFVYFQPMSSIPIPTVLPVHDLISLFLVFFLSITFSHSLPSPVFLHLYSTCPSSPC